MLKRLTPLQALLTLGGLTAVTLYLVLMAIATFSYFVFHWNSPVTSGFAMDLVPGVLIVAVLNMFLWILFVILPRRRNPWSAGLAGLCCGLIAPSIIAIVAPLFSLLYRGYFLNYAGAHSTNLSELQWPLTVGPILYTVFFGWFTVLVCIGLDLLLVRWLDATFQRTSSSSGA